MQPPPTKRSGERNTMKRDFLKNFKVGDREIPKEIIDAILDENSRDIDATKNKYSDYDTIKQQLEDANATIEGFKGMDIETVRKEADDWKDKFEQAQKDAADKIAEIEFDNLLSSAISGAKGRNVKAVKALLDLDTLKSSKNQEKDIKSALDALKKDSGYLFEEASQPPYAGGTGKDPIGDKSPDQMSYTELCEFMAANPDATI